MSFNSIPATLAEHAVNTPNLQAIAANEAILGAQRANWIQPEEGSASAGIWHDGKFALGDFKNLASFLARSSAPQIEKAL
jgi:hypothetical protein